MNLDKKLELAHEWSMWFLDKNKDLAFAPNTVTYNAWDYADAMEAEYKKRKQAEGEKNAEDAKVFFDKLTKNEDGSCKHINTSLNGAWCFDCGGKMNITNSSQLDWQPDWSFAPDDAMYWAMDEDTRCNWYGKEPEMIVVRNRWDFGNVLKSSPSFNYQGDWKDSLRKRPK